MDLFGVRLFLYSMTLSAAESCPWNLAPTWPLLLVYICKQLSNLSTVVHYTPRSTFSLVVWPSHSTGIPKQDCIIFIICHIIGSYTPYNFDCFDRDADDRSGSTTPYTNFKRYNEPHARSVYLECYKQFFTDSVLFDDFLTFLWLPARVGRPN